MERTVGIGLACRDSTCWRALCGGSRFFTKDAPDFIIEMLKVFITGWGRTSIGANGRHDSGELWTRNKET